jgi:ubiquinone/menaquinone biosynthesis C-methylase UbiE
MAMNSNHARLCPSPEWAEHIQNEILPEVTRGIELGQDMLEIGPGPGAATEWLRQRVRDLTVVEFDEEAAAKLTERYAGTNVRVVIGSAAELTYPDESFDSVGTFTMLHHIPTLALQNKVLAEAFRVLRPGGALVGSDSLPSNDLHHFHVDDTYNPLAPAALLTRLPTIGFARVTITVDWSVKFVATKAAPPGASDGPGGA